MPQQDINFGAYDFDPDADPIRLGGQKINENFTELYDIKLTGTAANDTETQTNTAPAGGKFVDTLRLFNFTLSDAFKGRVRAVLLTGLSLATGTDITATDSIIVAFGKLQVQLTNKIQSGFESTSIVKFISLVTTIPATQAANTLYLSETFDYEGSITVSASGTTTITIPHTLGSVPAYMELHAKNAAASGVLYRYCDASNLYAVYASSPTGSLDYWIKYKK